MAGLLTLLGSFLGQKDPGKKAAPYLNQIGPMATERASPYIQQGQNAGNQLYGNYSSRVSDPVAHWEKLMEGYTPSKGFQLKQQDALRAASNTAAAGGYRGSPVDQQRQMEIANALASEDQYNWMNNILGIEGTGLTGLENFAGRGFTANQDLTQTLGNSLASQGELAYRSQSQKNKDIQDFFKMLTQMAGSFHPMGGGGSGGNSGGYTPALGG
jgi:hypothetical protein